MNFKPKERKIEGEEQERAKTHIHDTFNTFSDIKCHEMKIEKNRV